MDLKPFFPLVTLILIFGFCGFQGELKDLQKIELYLEYKKLQLYNWSDGLA